MPHQHPARFSVILVERLLTEEVADLSCAFVPIIEFLVANMMIQKNVLPDGARFINKESKPDLPSEFCKVLYMVDVKASTPCEVHGLA